MTEFMYSTRKWKLVYSDRKQRSGCLGNGIGKKERLQKLEETFDEYVHYLDCDMYSQIYTHQNLPIHTLEYTVYYMSHFTGKLYLIG